MSQAAITEAQSLQEQYQARRAAITDLHQSFDHATDIAAMLVKQMRDGNAPWQVPQEPGSQFLPWNPVTGKDFSAGNAITLMSQAQEKGFTDTRWLTAGQAEREGGHVREDANGTMVEFWKWDGEQAVVGKDGKPVLDAQGQPEKRQVRYEEPRVFSSIVFNTEQIHGLPPAPDRMMPSTGQETLAAMLAGSRASIATERGSLKYSAIEDEIRLPSADQMPEADLLQITARGLLQATGHIDRLDRDTAHPMGSAAQAAEGLRVEIGAMMLGSKLGIGYTPTRNDITDQQVSQAIQNDPREAFRAAADAEKAVALVQSFEKQTEAELPLAAASRRVDDYRKAVEQEARRDMDPEEASAIGKAAMRAIKTAFQDSIVGGSLRDDGHTLESLQQDLSAAKFDRLSEALADAEPVHEPSNDRDLVRKALKAVASAERWGAIEEENSVTSGADRSERIAQQADAAGNRAGAALKELTQSPELKAALWGQGATASSLQSDLSQRDFRVLNLTLNTTLRQLQRAEERENEAPTLASQVSAFAQAITGLEVELQERMGVTIAPPHIPVLLIGEEATRGTLLDDLATSQRRIEQATTALAGRAAHPGEGLLERAIERSDMVVDRFIDRAAERLLDAQDEFLDRLVDRVETAWNGIVKTLTGRSAVDKASGMVQAEQERKDQEGQPSILDRLKGLGEKIAQVLGMAKGRDELGTEPELTSMRPPQQATVEAVVPELPPPTFVRAEHPSITPASDERVYLAVPFGEKDEAKSSGAKWDKTEKAWFVPAGVALDGFAAWMPAKSTVHIDAGQNPREEFADTLRKAGLQIQGAPLMDGQAHRVQVEGDKGKERSGVYRGSLSGRPDGFFENYKDGTGPQSWKPSAQVAALSAQERAQMAAESAQHRQERAAEREKMYERTAQKADALWAGAAPASPQHPYLLAKGIEPHDLRQDEHGRLLVPVQNADGKIMSLQSIDEDGGKKFVAEGRTSGGHHVLGDIDKPGPLLIAEGIATAATVHEISGQPTVVAFNAYNLAKVAETYRAEFPDRAIYIAADNDHVREAAGKPNVGKEKAEAAAKEIGGQVLLPPFAAGDKGTDWNDLARDKGRTAATAALRTAFKGAQREHLASDIEATRSVDHSRAITPAMSATKERSQQRPGLER